MEFVFIAYMEKNLSEGKCIRHPSSFPNLPLSSRKAKPKKGGTYFIMKDNSMYSIVCMYLPLSLV